MDSISRSVSRTLEHASSATALVSLLLLMPPASAAEPTAKDRNILEEVIVTAQYRSENLQDTPIAITAVKGERLEEQGITRIGDLGQIVPNADFAAPTVFNGPNASLSMRGVATTDFNYTSDPGVGIYIDDVYHGTLSGSDMDLLDLDRVEVLRGPQGTLFGKNNLGGAIRMFSKQPKGDDTGNVELTYGTSNRFDLKGSFDFALADNLFVRASGVSRQIDGYQDVLDFTCQMKANGTPALAGTFPSFVPSNKQLQGDCKIGEQGGSESRAGRLMLRYLPSTDLEINWDVDYSKTVAQPPPVTLLTGYHPGDADYAYGLSVVQPMFGVLPDDRFATPNQPFTTYGYPADPVNGKIWPVGSTTQAWSTAGRIDYNFTDNLHLKLIGAYRTYDNDWLANAAVMPIDLHNTLQLQSHEQKTLEARLNGQAFSKRLDWTAGLYRYDSESKQGGYITVPAFGLNFAQNDSFTTKSNSAFVHGVLAVTDALSVSAGGRYTDEKRTYLFDHGVVVVPLPPLLHYGTSHFDYKFSVDYRWNPSLMTYALVSSGFRSDGANPTPFTVGQQQTPTTAEKMTAYEVGLKSDFFDRRLRVNLSAFLNKYSPRVANGFAIQCNRANDPDAGPIYPAADPFSAVCPANTPVGQDFLAGSGPPAIPWSYYTSAPGKLRGLELEVTAEPISGLEITASGGYLTYKSDVDPSTPGYVDPTARQQPRFSGSLGTQYKIKMSSGALVPRLDMFYRGERTASSALVSLVQRHPDDFVPAYTLFNARVTYLSDSGKWSAALAAQNLFDKFYWANLTARTNPDGTPRSSVLGTPGRGREISFSVRRNFF